MKKPEQLQKSATSAAKSLGTAKLETVEGSGQTKPNRDTTIVYIAKENNESHFP